MIWTQSIRGRAIDLVHPTAAQVDFREIADTLAGINRYTGAAAPAVSVAFHTLIACDAADEGLKPWVLLHDAHEYAIGDITTPTELALQEVAAGMASTPAGRKPRAAVVAAAIEELKRRHDGAIHTAAGLPLPSAQQAHAIRRVDILALNTERRQFLAKPPQAWADAIERLGALPRTYRWKPPADVADELYRRFTVYLPALNGSPLRAA